MIRLRQLRERHSRVCDGCGLHATHQIIAMSMNGNEPHANVVDLCERCSTSLETQIDKRSKRVALKKLGVRT